MNAFTKYDNAIYEGTGDGENFDVATKSMAKEGLAIMVFPADLENLGSTTNGGNGSTLKIEIDKS